MSIKQFSIFFLSAVVVVVSVLLLSSSSSTSLITAQTTTSPPSTALKQFTVRSIPFSNGNDAMTFQDQLTSVMAFMARAIANTSRIVLDYNASSQSQTCWADVQECAQTFTWWFTSPTAADNQARFLAKGYTNDQAAAALNVEIFREGTSVPPKTSEDPSIMPFLMTLGFVYGGMSVASLLCVGIAYKIANK
jgi:hypothetical protein